MRSIGPAVGGIIVAVAGAAFAFAVNAVSYFALIRALALWKPEQAPNTLPRESFGSAMSAGLRYIALSPNLLKVMFRSFIDRKSVVQGKSVSVRVHLGGR